MPCSRSVRTAFSTHTPIVSDSLRHGITTESSSGPVSAGYALIDCCRTHDGVATLGGIPNQGGLAHATVREGRARSEWRHVRVTRAPTRTSTVGPTFAEISPLPRLSHRMHSLLPVWKA